MKVFYGVSRGRSHTARDVPCQDSLLIKARGSAVIFAVADGAGSAPLSHLGSALAVKKFCESTERTLHRTRVDQLSLARILEETREALTGAAKKMKCPVVDLHTTFLGGVYAEKSLQIIGIGDTLSFVIESDGKIAVPIQPTKGDFLNETIFLTSEGWKEYIRLSEVIRKPKALVACSDGLTGIVYDLIKHDASWNILPNEKFIHNLVRCVSRTAVRRDINREIDHMLSGEKANNLNDDDKALIVALFE